MFSMVLGPDLASLNTASWNVSLKAACGPPGSLIPLAGCPLMVSVSIVTKALLAEVPGFMVSLGGGEGVHASNGTTFSLGSVTGGAPVCCCSTSTGSMPPPGRRGSLYHLSLPASGLGDVDTTGARYLLH